jgi:flagellar hook assembly protein FlgD
LGSFGFDSSDPLVCHVGSGVAISFYIEEAAVVHLDIYDVRGRTVRQLVRDTMGPGNHSVMWNGTDDRSRRVWPGVYFLRLRSASEEATKKILVVE